MKLKKKKKAMLYSRVSTPSQKVVVCLLFLKSIVRQHGQKHNMNNEVVQVYPKLCKQVV
ncbi:hypothetical protein Hanom_Chr09g00789331 [Helianthus anomalus]